MLHESLEIKLSHNPDSITVCLPTVTPNWARTKSCINHRIRSMLHSNHQVAYF